MGLFKKVRDAQADLEDAYAAARADERRRARDGVPFVEDATFRRHNDAIRAAEQRRNDALRGR